VIYVIDMGDDGKKIYLYAYAPSTWDWWEFMPVYDGDWAGAHLTKMFHLSGNDSKVMVF
jgi:hypothetical protein